MDVYDLNIPAVKFIGRIILIKDSLDNNFDFVGFV